MGNVAKAAEVHATNAPHGPDATSHPGSYCQTASAENNSIVQRFRKDAPDGWQGYGARDVAQLLQLTGMAHRPSGLLMAIRVDHVGRAPEDSVLWVGYGYAGYGLYATAKAANWRKKYPYLMKDNLVLAGVRA